MRPDSRVVPGRKKDEHTPQSDCRRMSVSSFSVHQDATGHQGSARRKKGYQHSPPRGRSRMSLSSFRVHQDATGQQSIASTENT
ncbi:hypothetical protein TNCV_4587601 [Trichonephila clavipes]|uniref:Uncharacterized protein n=1 Tax=Trichonephila clavipes TaxID=2585209 RepID=A0A8X6VD78_TRICX|nr:hypothetical protein TNCV_4587601 [Trichonephila clavipes]